MLARSASRAATAAARRARRRPAGPGGAPAPGRTPARPPRPTAAMTSRDLGVVGLRRVHQARRPARRPAASIRGSAAISGSVTLCSRRSEPIGLPVTAASLGVVEQVVHDLERHAQRLAEAAERRALLRRGARSAPTSQAPDSSDAVLAGSAGRTAPRRTPAARAPGAAASRRPSSRWSPGSAPAAAPGRPSRTSSITAREYR